MRRFYLLPKENDPYRCTQSKRFNIKVMTSRTLYDTYGNIIHDGKFGIYPFVERFAAKKTSKIRVASTIETRPIEKNHQRGHQNCHC